MASVDYLNKLKELQKPTYTSQYGGVISDLMGQIVNRKPFSYDFNADPMYQQYKDYYTKMGKEASMNAVANASALTGGYGNSYAVTAGAQANQQALSGLNNIIPQLYNAAQKKYETDLNALYADYDMYKGAEDDAYGKYRDQLSDYNNERSYLTNMYNTELAQENYLAELAEEQRQFDAQQALALAKLNAKGSGSGGKKTNSTVQTPVADAIASAAKVVAGVGKTPYKDTNWDNDKVMANEVAYAKEAARNKSATPTSSQGYTDYALTQKAIQVLNGTRDINQVDTMLEEQIKKGVITENEALQILDKVVKSR